MDSAKSIASCWYLSYLARSRISGASSQMTLTFSAVTADMDSSRFPSALLRTARQLNLSDDFLSFSGGTSLAILCLLNSPNMQGLQPLLTNAEIRPEVLSDQSIRENLRVTCLIPTRWVAAQLPVIRYNFSGALNGGGANDVE